jgi:hypothetical protein
MIFEEHQPEEEQDRKARHEVQRWIARILQTLEAEECPAALLQRFDGLLSSMMGLSNRERLGILIGRGGIALEAAQRWQRLRPASAHGVRKGRSESDPLYYDCMAVLGLLYQLVAHVIDYRGRLRDLSAPGWRIKPYPFPTAATNSGDVTQPGETAVVVTGYSPGAATDPSG